MQINALPLSDKLAGEKLRDAETLGAQLARRRRWGAARRAALLLWHRSFPLAMFGVYKLVCARLLARRLSSSVSICFHPYGSLIDQLWHYFFFFS